MSSTNDFRADVRQWLERNCPPSQRAPIVKEEQIWAGRNRTFHSEDAKKWFEAMRERGWTAPQWPTALGGGGLNAEEAQILQAEMRRLNCRPPLYDLGLWMLGPALLTFGTEAQKAEHIPKIARGEIRWCQGYSEPAAGSDLASLKTRAEDHGDYFLVNGTKLWTTQADKADWIFCLVRSDPDAKKQDGISFLLIDMQSEGVSTSPIELISGESEFCQTFFDNVKVPKANLVGELHKGWQVAKELLKHERKLMSVMAEISEKEEQDILALARRYLGTDEENRLADPVLRDQITQHLMRSDADKATNFRLYQQMKAGQFDSKLPLIMKHVSTKEYQRKDELLLKILGNRGLGWQDNAEFSDDEQRVMRNWANDKAHTIAGGTSEIQLNIIARKALDLPQ